MLSAISYQLSAKVKNILLCLLSGILLSLSFSFSQCWILAWVGFVPLFLVLNNQSAKQAFFLAYFTGIIFWAGTIYWLVNVTLLGQIILILYLALYFGLFGLLISFSCQLSAVSFQLSAASLWVILEYLRSHLLTGFPWALLGYAQYANLPIIQIADIAGAWLVSFLVMMVNAAISYQLSAFSCQLSAISFQLSAFSCQPSLKAARLRCLWLPVLCLTLTLAYGYYKLCLKPKTQNLEPIKISVIQGNIPQALKWDPRAREFVMQKYFKLTDQAKQGNPDLIIWPEAALPVVLEEEPVYYARLLLYTKTIERPLLFGAVTSRAGLYYNSALLLSKEGDLLERYDKLHLVPFGEFIPGRKFFPFLETIAPIGDISPGRDYTLFSIQHQGARIWQQFGVLICFEDVFPELSRRFVNKGADFLVNITNDAWFGRTSEAYQHLAASVFRAIENRVNLVRSANTGVSTFINPQGKILVSIRNATGNTIFIPGYLTQDIIPQNQSTLYGRYGDFLLILCLGYVLGGFIYSSLRTRAQRG